LSALHESWGREGLIRSSALPVEVARFSLPALENKLYTACELQNLYQSEGLDLSQDYHAI